MGYKITKKGKEKIRIMVEGFKTELRKSSPNISMTLPKTIEKRVLSLLEIIDTKPLPGKHLLNEKLNTEEGFIKKYKHNPKDSLEVKKVFASLKKGGFIA